MKIRRKTLVAERVRKPAEIAGNQNCPAEISPTHPSVGTDIAHAAAVPQDRGTWTLDTAAKPKGMKITGVKGPNAGKTFPAIYELKADTLRVCYDLSGAKRPMQFKTSAGTKLYLVTYHWQKK